MKILIYKDGKSNESLRVLLDKMNIKYDVHNEKEHYDYIVKPPGIKKCDCPTNGKLVTDIEFIYELLKPNIIGITGSNGKTTVTTMINNVLDDIDVSMGGNIGIPFAQIINNHSTFILELSSFQLECVGIKPKIAVMLDIKPCHLDHHNTFEAYFNSKMNLVRRIEEKDYIIYSYDDTLLRNEISKIKCRKLSFSEFDNNADIYICNNKIIFENDIIDLEKYNIDKIKLKNTLPAILVGYLYNKKPLEAFLKAISISKIKYRMEKLDEYTYNDAKSTNVYSTIEALKTFDKVNLIMGGYDRGDDVSPLINYLDKVDYFILYGQNRKKYNSFLQKYTTSIKMFETLSEAYNYAKTLKGILLYSPASPSYDQYESFEQRGKEFEMLHKKKA